MLYKKVLILLATTLLLVVNAFAASTDEHAGHDHSKHNHNQEPPSKEQIDAMLLRVDEAFEKAKEQIASNAEVNPNNYEEGKHFQKFETEQPLYVGEADKIEVLEFFSFACPHCFSAEPFMAAYEGQVADDVNFVRVPAVFNRTYEKLARAYLAGEMLNADHVVGKELFKAIHVKGERFNTPKDLANFYAGFGVDKDKFLEAFESLAVDTRIKRIKELTVKYTVKSVPATVVNGKYITGAQNAGGLGAWFHILDQLTEQERKALTK